MAHERFRANEIAFLQQKNNEILAVLGQCEAERDEALEQIAACEEKDTALQGELQGSKDRISALASLFQQSKSEIVAKDEHVRVQTEQNKHLLSVLESVENKSKESQDRIQSVEARNKKLQRVADVFDAAKADLERQVAEAKAKGAENIAKVQGQRGLNETLRANIQNTEARVRVDIESLGQALQVCDNKNLEYMQKINGQEAKEQKLQSETAALKEEVESARTEIDKLRKRLEGDEEGRTTFERARSQLEVQIESLEVQADTLKKALTQAERANEQLQEENRGSQERCRENHDKVYALMDALRLNQVELKKQEAENVARDKKLNSLERQSQNLQAKISMETDAKVLAEQERKEAEQESNVLKKKNKKIEEAVTVSQQAQEKAEREIAEMNEKVGQLQTKNAYLASRIDAQDEEKNSVKSEIKKASDRANALTAENSQIRDQIDKLEEAIATTASDMKQYQGELEYIKREDVLDEAGRQRPIMIQSTESDLLEKLQINEFLYEAQQARNPVPPVIEKIAQLLMMLHEAQQRSDLHLHDLSKSNGLVSALRQRNVALFTRTQMFESFKTRALLRYVMNLIEADKMTDLHLDGLSFGPREINEMIGVLQRYEATDKVFVLSLIDNGLDEDSINLILQLIFTLPYMRALDLRKNCIGPDGIKKIEDQLRSMEGVTGVVKTATQVINVHSGNQLRLSIDVSEQMPKEQVAKEVDFSIQHELSHQDADPFLDTQQGQSQHPWTKTAVAQQRSPLQAVPDASATELLKPAGAPMAPAVGGPPVGLGGPGNLAALSKKAMRGKNKPPDPRRRQARRAKGAPPEALDEPAGGDSPSALVLPSLARTGSTHGSSPVLQPSAAKRAGSFREPRAAAPPAHQGPGHRRVASVERSSSMPAFPRPAR
mmetsp:Transcript_13809/g.39289  ORF Transcript_13809/g.39289 Transcript_13809/m.39289 type:complete len:895 (+) Transcript_13809:123-2807(+)